MISKYKLQQLRENWQKYKTRHYKNKTGRKDVQVKTGIVVYIDPRVEYKKGHFGVIKKMCNNNSAKVASKLGVKDVPMQ